MYPFTSNFYPSSYGSSIAAGAVALVVCAILAVAGAIVLMVTFLSKKNEHKFSGILDWLYDFLNFKKLLIDIILRFVYLVGACFVTLMSLYSLFTGSFLGFLGMLIIGNLVLRLAYELTMMLVILVNNVTSINKKLQGPSNDNCTDDPPPFA